MSIQPANRISTVEEYYFSTKLKELDQLNQQEREIMNPGIMNLDIETQ